MSERLTTVTILRRDPTVDHSFAPTPLPGTLIIYSGGALRPSLYCPACGKSAGLDNHTVQETAPGIFTLSPSCRCPREICNAHYYVRENRIDWI